MFDLTPQLDCAGRLLKLDRPRVMGIVNVTPDSFSDGGRHAGTAAALAHCEQLLAEGADLLDIGGESTRPGSPAVALEEELARVLPVVQGAVTLGVPVSVDTYKPELMRAVLDVGAGEGQWRAPLIEARPRLEYVGLDPSPYVVERFGRTRGRLSRRRKHITDYGGVPAGRGHATRRGATATHQVQRRGRP